VAGYGDWTDGSRLEDGSVGCAVARYYLEHVVWTGVRVHMGRTRRSTTLSYTPFTVLYSRFSKLNPAARRSPSSQRQPYRGSQPTYQVQDSDISTLSRSHNRHTTCGSNEESPSNPDGSPAMQAPPVTRRSTRGQRWQHGTNAVQSNCLTSSAARPSPTYR